MHTRTLKYDQAHMHVVAKKLQGPAPPMAHQDASMRDDPQNGGDEFDSEEGLLGPDEDICPRRISRNFRCELRHHACQASGDFPWH